MASPWPSPSFMGRYLPASQTIDQDGFSAKWSISYLGRSYGQLWDGANSTEPTPRTVLESAFGVTLLNPVDAYRETDRAIKYGVLFIALTFAACLMFEFVGGTRPSVAQYGLIGLSLCVFYLLLLSLSEQIGFGLGLSRKRRRRGGAGGDLQLGPAATPRACSGVRRDPGRPLWRPVRTVAARGRGVCWRARCCCSPCCRSPCGSPATCIASSLPELGKLAFHRRRRNDAPVCFIPECRMRSAVLACLLALAAGPAFGQKQVNVYNWSDYIAEDQLKIFSKDTGIKVNYTTYDSNEILDAKLKTGRSGYDVVVPTASPFFVRQLAAKLYQPLDRAKLKNWGNLDPRIMAELAKYDPGNAHAIPWMWGTIGIGYNVDAIKKRMVNAPVDSLSMIFDPAIVSRFVDCGVMVLDSPTDVFPAALKYLLLDPDSKKTEDLEKAAAVIKAIRPFVRKFHSSEYINALAGGDICLTFGFSGDIFQARARAAAAAEKRDIAYAIPNQGAMLWIDVAAIPKDAPNPEAANRFIDFMLEPKVAAASSDLTGYANGNAAATPLMDKSITQNPLIYLSADNRAKLYTITAAHRRAGARAHPAVDVDQDRPMSEPS